jgi:hypothetical protein
VEPTSFLRAGVKVRIVRGPLRGVEGHVDSVKSLDRIVVRITLLQRAVSVEIDSGTVLSVAEPDDYAAIRVLFPDLVVYEPPIPFERRARGTTSGIDIGDSLLA